MRAMSTDTVEAHSTAVIVACILASECTCVCVCARVCACVVTAVLFKGAISVFDEKGVRYRGASSQWKISKFDNGRLTSFVFPILSAGM